MRRASAGIGQACARMLLKESIQRDPIPAERSNRPRLEGVALACPAQRGGNAEILGVGVGIGIGIESKAF